MIDSIEIISGRYILTPAAVSTGGAITNDAQLK